MNHDFIYFVGVYQLDGHRVNTISFKHRWQAYLFHIILNASISHNGTREY